jgi:hypothetical protein
MTTLWTVCSRVDPKSGSRMESGIKRWIQSSLLTIPFQTRIDRSSGVSPAEQLHQFVSVKCRHDYTSQADDSVEGDPEEQ